MGISQPSKPAVFPTLHGTVTPVGTVTASPGDTYYDTTTGTLGWYCGATAGTITWILIKPTPTTKLLKIVAPNGSVRFTVDATVSGSATIGGPGTTLGFYGHARVAQPTVTGSKVANPALTSLMTALADLGLVKNTTS